MLKNIWELSKANLNDFVVDIQNRWYLYCFPLFLFMGMYLQSLEYPFFLFDDPLHITNKSEVIYPTIKNIIGLWGSSKTPLILNIWQMVSAIFGVDNPIPYRVLNFLFHIINVYLFYNITLKLTDLMRERGLITVVREKVERYTYFALFLFIVHPLLVESLVWISSLRTVLSTTFALLSFRIYLNMRSDIDDYKTIFLSFIPFVLGIIVKPAIVSLILIFLFLDFYLYGKKTKETMARLFPFVLFVIIVIALQIAGSLGVGRVELRLHVKVLLFFKTFFFYMTKFLAPIDLSFFYSDNIKKFEESLGAGSSNIWLVVQVVILSIVFFFLYLKKNRSKISWGMAFFLFALLPHMGLLSFDFQRLSLYADRYSYFAFYGLVFAMLFIFIELDNRFSKRATWFEGIYIFIIFLLVILSVRQIKVWSKNSKVMERAYRISNYASYVEQPLFATYMDEHDYTKAAKFLSSITESDLGRLIELYHPVHKMHEQVMFHKLFSKILVPQAYSTHYIKFLVDAGKYAEALDYLNSNSATIKKKTYEDNKKMIEREMKDEVSRSWLILGDYFYINNKLELASAMYKQALQMVGEVTDQSRASIIAQLMGADKVPKNIIKAAKKSNNKSEANVEMNKIYDLNKYMKDKVKK